MQRRFVAEDAETLPAAEAAGHQVGDFPDIRFKWRSDPDSSTPRKHQVSNFFDATLGAIAPSVKQRAQPLDRLADLARVAREAKADEAFAHRAERAAGGEPDLRPAQRLL